MSDRTLSILFATNLRPWGGGEQWMLSTALAMHTRGHRVTLAAPSDSVIAARATAAGLKLVACGFRRDFDPVSFLRIFSFCVRQHVDVLCLNMDRVLRVAGNAARLAGVRAVLPRRGSEFPLKNRLRYRFHYRNVASGIIVNSQATATTLCRDISWQPRRIYLLYNGLDLERFAPDKLRSRAETRDELGLAPGAIALINVGELTSRKNAILLVHALAALPVHCHAFFIGDGPERDNLLTTAQRLGVDDRVHLLGFREDVPDLLIAGDVLVHCARVEGFGFVVAEAGAAGLPVVAAATSSVPEIVVDGKTAALFRDDDVGDLVRVLGPYLEDPLRRRKHGEAGRRHIATHFELQSKMDELEAIFRSEIANRGSRNRRRP